MQNWVQRLVGLSDLWSSVACPLCQRTTSEVLCCDCQRQIEKLKLSQPQQFWQPPLPVFAWGSYGGSLKRVIAALKYNNQPRLAEPLGVELAQGWLSAAPTTKPVTVVPIPMHLDKQRQRGFNQAELIAKVFCRCTGLPFKQGLIRHSFTEAQFELSAAAREQNLAGAFQLGQAFLRQPPLNPVLLLDDIYTTGATARAAAQTLRRHQISVCGIAVIAKAMLIQNLP